MRGPRDGSPLEEGRVFANVLRVEEENGQMVSRVRAGLGGTLHVLRVPEPPTLLPLARRSSGLGRPRAATAR